jgi:L-alanine-DL-glutamate epimerase-like enolase superfamily enzyme
MDAVKTWTVQVQIDEHDSQTRAVALLRIDDSESITGTGLARLNPDDRDVPEIGDELAVARALSELSHRLLDAAASEIEQSSGVPAHPVL